MPPKPNPIYLELEHGYTLLLNSTAMSESLTRPELLAFTVIVSPKDARLRGEFTLCVVALGSWQSRFWYATSSGMLATYALNERYPSH